MEKNCSLTRDVMLIHSVTSHLETCLVYRIARSGYAGNEGIGRVNRKDIIYIRTMIHGGGLMRSVII